MKKSLAAFVLSVSTGLVLAQAVPPEVKVGGRNIIDYEFDWGRDGVYCESCNYNGGNNRFAFVDPQDNTVYIGRIDPNTGFFQPPDGHGTAIDHGNAVTAERIGNGPEWVLSQRGSELTYTRYTTGAVPGREYMSIGYAYVSGASQSWAAGSLPNSTNMVLPIGSMNLDNTAPMLSFQNHSAASTDVFWQIESGGTSVHTIALNSAVSGVTRRWVTGTTKMLMTYPDAYAVRQVFLYDTKTGSASQLTFDAAPKVWAFMWAAPEYPGEYVFFAQTGQSEIDVYRHDPGATTWHVIDRIMMPAATPYMASPEPFVHNGKSWLMFTVTATPGARDYTVTSHPAIVGINAGEQIKILTNDATNQFVRRDPEYYITAKGPFVYYNAYAKNSDPAAKPVSLGVYRVDTGLGAPIAAKRQAF